MLPPGHGGKVAKARGHVFLIQGCPLQAPSTTGHISHSPDPEQSPVTFPTTLWLLATWSFFYQCCPDLGAFTHANLFSPQSTLLFFRLFTPLQMGKKKTSASATPMLPPTQEADGAFDSSHGSTLLYLLRADLYISNTCKLSPTANRPSLLILTSEGALLYFSINSPPPSTFSLPSQAPLSPS